MWNDMFNIEGLTTSGNTPYTASDTLDSKYTVADILSSMATGSGSTDPLTLHHQSAPTFTCGVSNLVTPTLTPTSLGGFPSPSSFIELRPVTSSAVSERTRRAQLYRESGFVPPIVSPICSTMPAIKQEPQNYDNEWSPSAKRVCMAPPAMSAMNPSYVDTAAAAASLAHRRNRMGNTKLDEADDERRMIRRERNKLAAAKCRQRRVDHTNVLVKQTEALEETQSVLENEIQKLQRQKDQLEFLLEAHKPLCHANDGRPVGVKLQKPPHLTQTTRTSRPDSLLLPSSVSISAVTAAAASTTFDSLMGVAITTPSSGLNLCSIGLDSMMNGHTGLTPITGTPSCTTTCSTQAQRSSSDSSPDSLTSSQLMAL